ncbi:MAG: aminoglycoside phosphotransferase family protein [Syntrophaceae bacterium]|nr:aminoglycoside phosphotransferase family protein [Syntrophaceae bacterium]
MTIPHFSDILRHWDIEFKAERPELTPAGSPERSLFRTVVEDAGGRRFVLEQVAPRTVGRKREIAATLDWLVSRGLAGVRGYLRNGQGDSLVKEGGGFWQISPFVDGVELARPGYAFEAWRGQALARFLIDLKETSQGIPFGKPGRPFPIAEFIRDLMTKIARHAHGCCAAVRRVHENLEACLFPVHDRLPAAFCHGDPHPVNVIWGEEGIRGVIDWEFSGYKPEIYDAALVLGCLGMEDPEALAGPMALAFIGELRASGRFDASGFAVLPEFVTAVRFAWLSDWLRKQDGDMVEMETDYLNLLHDSREELRLAWDR